MSKKSEIYYALYELKNNKTGETWQARGLNNVINKAGLSIKTPSAQIKRSKKWTLVQIDDPQEWDESAYRSNLYKNTKHRYKTYEERKLLRDPLFERRKQIRLRGWINKDGSQFTAEQHDSMLQKSCQACGSTHRVCVDHDHNTMIVRGTLCSKCNLALGHVDDSVDRLQALIQYLKLSEIYGGDLNAEN